MTVFCDWLDVTFKPTDSPVSQIRLWLDSMLCPVRYEDDQGAKVDVGYGLISFDTRERFHRISASGAALEHFRLTGELENYLSLLASQPHTVTRLDAARDYPVDAPPFLRRLEERYPNDKVNLQRKALRVTRMYSSRDSDGALTGTWYVGHRSQARVTARVYDKQAEALEKRGEELPPTTRVELTFRKDHGCTLRDAAMPYSLYHQFASPALVEKPSDAPEWSPHGEGWSGDPVTPKLPLDLFKRRVEYSPELARLIELSKAFGEPGIDILLRTLETQIRQAHSDHLHTLKSASSAG